MCWTRGSFIFISFFFYFAMFSVYVWNCFDLQWVKAKRVCVCVYGSIVVLRFLAFFLLAIFLSSPHHLFVSQTHFLFKSRIKYVYMTSYQYICSYHTWCWCHALHNIDWILCWIRVSSSPFGSCSPAIANLQPKWSEFPPCLLT